MVIIRPSSRCADRPAPARRPVRLRAAPEPHRHRARMPPRRPRVPRCSGWRTACRRHPACRPGRHNPARGFAAARCRSGAARQASAPVACGRRARALQPSPGTAAATLHRWPRRRVRARRAGSGNGRARLRMSPRCDAPRHRGGRPPAAPASTGTRRWQSAALRAPRRLSPRMRLLRPGAWPEHRPSVTRSTRVQ